MLITIKMIEELMRKELRNNWGGDPIIIETIDGVEYIYNADDGEMYSQHDTSYFYAYAEQEVDEEDWEENGLGALIYVELHYPSRLSKWSESEQELYIYYGDEDLDEDDLPEDFDPAEDDDWGIPNEWIDIYDVSKPFIE